LVDDRIIIDLKSGDEILKRVSTGNDLEQKPIEFAQEKGMKHVPKGSFDKNGLKKMKWYQVVLQEHFIFKLTIQC
jgi:hypothetical protein